MSAADEGAAADADSGSRVTHYAGVVAGVVLSGCSTLTRSDTPLNEDASGLEANQFSSDSEVGSRPNATPESSSTPTTEPTASPTATSTETEESPTATATATEDSPTPTATATEESPTPTETARPADAGSGGVGGSAAASSGGGSLGGGGGGSSGGSGGGGGTAPTSTATPGTTTETATPTETATRSLRTPVETVTGGAVSSPLTGTITVSDRETGYLCLLDVDSPVSFSFAGETADGGAVNWYLCDPTTLESYWAGETAGVFASFRDWPTFEFGPYTTGPGPTALLVEPVGDPVTLSYSITVE